MGVQLPRHAPINLRVGKSGNPPDLESGDPVFESPRADHICFGVERSCATRQSNQLAGLVPAIQVVQLNE